MLREEKVLIASLIDDRIEILCSINITKIIELLTSLEFVIHTTKPIFVPSKEIEFLGWIKILKK